MSSPVHLRRARPDDAEAIARVHVETWRTAYAGILPENYLVSLSLADEAHHWRDIITQQAARAVTLLAYAGDGPDGETVIGFGSARPSQNLSMLYDGEVQTLYVLPDWQGQGIGRMLLGALFRHLYDHGMEDAILWVLEANPSRFFYEHMGGAQIAQHAERVAGQSFTARAYGWNDLEAWLRQVGL